MGIQYGWLVDDVVILTRMTGEVSTESFRQWADALNPFYDQIDYPRMHIIIDATDLEKTPTIKEMLDIPLHEKRGWVVIFGMSNRLLKFLASAVVQVTRTEVRFEADLTESLAMLRRVDANIPDGSNDPINWLEEID